MRSLAVVPPVLLDSRERRLRFENRNGLVEDPMADYRERSLLNVWSEQVCVYFDFSLLTLAEENVVLS